MRGPFVIKRYRHNNGDHALRWRYELWNTENDTLVMETTTSAPVPPRPIRDKQARLNTRWLMDKYVGG